MRKAKAKAQLLYPIHTTEFRSTIDDSGYSQPKNQKTQRNIQKKSNVIQFQHFSYPFLNEYSAIPKIFKTQLFIGSQQLYLKKVLQKNNHPNLIILTELQQKTLRNKRETQVVLDIAYEEVAFSIKFIGFADRSSSSLHQKIASINFRDVLNKVSIYLMKLGINRVIKLADIGVTQSGIIKIFLPLNALLYNDEALPQHVIFSNNYKLVSWWETTFNKQTLQPRQTRLYSPKNKANILQTLKLQKFNHFKQQERQNYSFLNRAYQTRILSRNWDNSGNIIKEIEKQALKATKDSHRESFQSKGELQGLKQPPILKTSIKSHDSVFSKMEGLQAQKIKRIDRQIKQIKQRLVMTQTLKSQNEDSKHIIYYQNEKVKDSTRAINLLSSEQKENSLVNFEDRPQEQPIYRDSIQNINCINTYHASNSNFNGLIPKKIAAFTKISYLDLLECVSKEDSLDNYDIWFGNNQEAINTRPKSNLQCWKYERQTSQRNHKVKRDSEVQSKGKSNQYKNQVQSRTFQTESAGPKQFKNFIKNCTYPQFLSKKSNINEDPMEQENQHYPIPHKVPINKLAEAGRSVISKTRQSVSTKKQKNKLRNNKNSTTVMQMFEQIPTVRSVINTGIGFRYVVRLNRETQGETYLAKKKLEVRVHNIVQKTKNMIAFLNRMKQGNGLIRKTMSP